MTAKPKPILPPPRKNPAAAAPAKPKVAQVTNSTKPEDIIPMDDDGDFEDF
jgi:hypothetical protein